MSNSDPRLTQRKITPRYPGGKIIRAAGQNVHLSAVGEFFGPGAKLPEIPAETAAKLTARGIRVD